jgi:hypothetical protein
VEPGSGMLVNSANARHFLRCNIIAVFSRRLLYLKLLMREMQSWVWSRHPTS